MDRELLVLPDQLTVERRTCSRCGYGVQVWTSWETRVMVPDRSAWARVCINVRIGSPSKYTALLRSVAGFPPARREPSARRQARGG